MKNRSVLARDLGRIIARRSRRNDSAFFSRAPGTRRERPPIRERTAFCRTTNLRAPYFFLLLIAPCRVASHTRIAATEFHTCTRVRYKSLWPAVYAEKIRSFYAGAAFVLFFSPFPTSLRPNRVFRSFLGVFTPVLFLLFPLPHFPPSRAHLRFTTYGPRVGPVKRQLAFGLPESSAKKINELPILRRHSPTSIPFLDDGAHN